MKKKACFGLIKEIFLGKEATQTRSRTECNECPHFKDCLFYEGIDEEDRKQDKISRIIDNSEVVSNELGSCLLEFLSRMYSLPAGAPVFESLVLFYELPEDSPFLVVKVPVHNDLLSQKLNGGEFADGRGTTLSNRSQSEQWITAQVVLLRKVFCGNQMANMGMIVHGVATLVATNETMSELLVKAISPDEGEKYKRMGIDQRVIWLIERWNFMNEYNAFKNIQS